MYYTYYILFYINTYYVLPNPECAIDSSRDLAPVQHVPLLIEARGSGAERISGGLSDKSI